MLLDWIILIVSFILQFILIPKPQNAKPASLEDFDVPVVEEGKEIGVLSGTETLKGPNVTWWGDLKIKAIKGKRRYILFGPRQILGYKYYIGMQMVLCNGPADELMEIWAEEKLIWKPATLAEKDIAHRGGTIFINQPDLYGGQEKGGGLQGFVDICMGGPDQGRNDYLARVTALGPNCSAYRGIVTVVLRQFYIGTTQYIKPWSFKLKRIHKKSSNEEQWYDDTADVPDVKLTVPMHGPGSYFFEENQQFCNHNGLMDTNGDYCVFVQTWNPWGWYAGAGWGDVRVYHLPEGTYRIYDNSITGFYTNDVHLTDFDEMMLRGGTAASTGIAFIRMSNFETAQVIETNIIFAGLNDELTIDDTPIPDVNGGFTVGEHAGVMVVKLTGGLWRGATKECQQPWIVLYRGQEWFVAQSYLGALPPPGADDLGCSAITIGPVYAYAIRSNFIVSRIRYAGVGGGWEEVHFDLRSLLEPNWPWFAFWAAEVNITNICYWWPTREVIITAGTFIYLFDETLTILRRSKNLSDVELFGNEQWAPLDFAFFLGSGGRMVVDDRKIMLVGQWIGHGQLAYLIELRVSNLTFARKINLYQPKESPNETTYPQTDWYYPLNANYAKYNRLHYGLFVMGHGFTVNAPASWWPTASSDGLDMNPAHIIREYLTDGRWGMGYNDADIDDDAFTYAADLFWNEPFGLTIWWVRQEAIEEMITIILAHCNAVLYVDRHTGRFVLTAIRNDYLLEDLPVFDESDVIEWTQVERRQPADAITSITVQYTERRTARSEEASATWHNDAQVQQHGGVILDSKNYPGISHFALATRVAERDQHPFNQGMITGHLTGKRTLQGLNPGSPFRLVSERQNLAGEPMRVVDMKFAAGRENAIDIKFIQDQFRLGAPELVEGTTEVWTQPGSVPQIVDPRLVWEMPYVEANVLLGSTALQQAMAADPNFGMLEIAGEQPSSDTTGIFVYVNKIEEQLYEQFAPNGFLSANITQYDTAMTINTTKDFDDIVDGMFAAIVEPSQRQIEIVRIDGRAGNDLIVSRGMLDTVPRAHLAGCDFVAFDDFSMSDFVARTATNVLTVKLLAQTPLAVRNYLDAPADTVTMDSRAIRPYRPANCEVEGLDILPEVDVTHTDPFTVTWARRNRLGELTTFKAWAEGDVAPETGQTTTINLIGKNGTTILHTYVGITGTSQVIDHVHFGTTARAFVEFASSRAGYPSWQAYRIAVLVGGYLLLEGDMADDAYDRVVFEGDEAPGFLML